MVLSVIARTVFFVGGTCIDDVLKVYAGAWRIVQGQLPYLDFNPQIVPLPHFVAAPFFGVLPPGLAAVSIAALENVAASLLMWGLILRVTHDWPAALVAGLLTAFWNLQVGATSTRSPTGAWSPRSCATCEGQPARRPASRKGCCSLAQFPPSSRSLSWPRLLPCVDPAATWPLRFDPRQRAAIKASQVIGASGESYALLGDVHDR